MLSVVIPAHNEEKSIGEVVRTLFEELPKTSWEFEIIVVNDGSEDHTEILAKEAGATVISHSHAHGYGQALRSGIHAAKNQLIAIIDADGSYTANDLVKLLPYVKSYDMVVGARIGEVYERGVIKFFARRCLISFCEFVTGSTIKDINSGLRIFRKTHILRFLNQLSYGFSFTTSLTMVLMLNGYFVGYIDIDYHEREGQSKVRHFRDSLRTLQIVFEAFARYNPIKLYLSVILFVIGFAALSSALLLSGLGSASLWLLLNLAIATISILAGLSFIAILLVHRSEKIHAPMNNMKLPEQGEDGQ